MIRTTTAFRGFIYTCLHYILVASICVTAADRTAIDIHENEVVEPVKVIRVVDPDDIVKPVIEPVVVTVVEEEIDILEEPVIEEVEYFDVPLEEDLQEHIFTLCETYEIDPALVIAVIQRESCFISEIVGDNGNSLGLMQIQPRWHQARMDRLGCPDLLDPYQNVEVGIDLLAELFDRGESVEWVLMAYNGGAGYAYKKIANGEISDYAACVLANSEVLERRSL